MADPPPPLVSVQTPASIHHHAQQQPQSQHPHQLQQQHQSGVGGRAPNNWPDYAHESQVIVGGGGLIAAPQQMHHHHHAADMTMQQQQQQQARRQQQQQQQHSNNHAASSSLVQHQQTLPQPPTSQTQQQPHQIFGPKVVTLRRSDGHGFGFTLRHFIVYPPDSCIKSPNDTGISSSSAGSSGGAVPASSDAAALQLVQPMETVFVKEVRPYGPAFFAGLQNGDRLLSVNGMSVAGIPYPRVVAAIQQAPPTLTLHVVPKECDILQTYFSETAHNPETNQRPKPAQQPQPPQPPPLPSEPPTGTMVPLFLQSAPTQYKPLKLHTVTRDPPYYRHPTPAQQPQSAGNATAAVAQGQHPSEQRRRGDDPIAIVHHAQATPVAAGVGMTRLHTTPGLQSVHAHLNAPSHVTRRDGLGSILAYDPHFAHLGQPSSLPALHTGHHPDAQKALAHASDRRESSASVASSIGSYDSGSTLTTASEQHANDSAIIDRLRRSMEQKEEFLRAPPTHREFYARPQRMTKTVWPPNDFEAAVIKQRQPDAHVSSPPPMPPMASAEYALKSDDLMQLQSKQAQQPLPPHRIANLMAREQFYNGSPEQLLSKQQQQSVQTENNERMRSPPPGALHMVSERTKQFESGRPLSPDGSSVDRTELFQSELCRISKKSVVPNVALRRKEFEQKATESNEWRRLSSDDPSTANDKPSSMLPAPTIGDDELSSSTGRTRSLSVDSASLASDANELTDQFNAFQYTSGAAGDSDFRRKKTAGSAAAGVSSVGPNGEHIKHIGGTNVIMRRHKSALMDESTSASTPVTPTNGCDAPSPVVGGGGSLGLLEDDRPMRRVSYLRATANDSALMDGSGDSELASTAGSSQSMSGATGVGDGSTLPATAARSPEAYDAQTIAQQLKSAYRPWRRPKFTSDIQPLRRIFEESPAPVALPASGGSPMCQSPAGSKPATPPATPVHYDWHHHLTTKSKALAYLRSAPANPMLPVTIEGELHVKITFIDSKRSPDRAWRAVNAELRGSTLAMTIHREGKSNQSPEPSGIIDLRSFHVAEGNYTKRKHVFKLVSLGCPTGASSASPSVQQPQPQQPMSAHSPTAVLATPIAAGTELLIQADGPQSMRHWMDHLKRASESQDLNSSATTPVELAHHRHTLAGGTQTAEPQRIAATTSVVLADDSLALSTGTGVRKYLGSRSPSGQSPVTKSRKTPAGSDGLSPPVAQQAADAASLASGQTNVSLKDSSALSSNSGGPLSMAAPNASGSDKEIGSPKTRTWKGLVARQFRRIQGGPSSPASTSGSMYADALLPEGASIGVPLAHCPMSEHNQFVPHLIARCTEIVEQRGLTVVGIYRVSGNKAAYTALKELVNRGLDEQTLADPKWEDVNVVASLLKLFIRELPDGLLPGDMYQLFIDADRQTGRGRMLQLKSLLGRLFRTNAHSYETLKHLMRHLHRVSEHSATNLMEPKNLAIIFGPTVVWTCNETMESAVKDMQHQCRIVEALVSHYEFFFENATLPMLADAPEYTTVSPAELQTNLLLDNLSKIEQRDGSRFVSKFGRKARKTHRKSSTLTPDSMSLNSSTSAESKDPKCGSESESSMLKSSGPDGDSQLHHGHFHHHIVHQHSRLSEDESNDAVFADNGSMSLTTVTLTLDDKLRSLRNSAYSAPAECPPTSVVPSAIAIGSAAAAICNQPLSLGENIPYADESPERPLIQTRSKPARASTSSSSNSSTCSSSIGYPTPPRPKLQPISAAASPVKVAPKPTTAPVAAAVLLPVPAGTVHNLIGLDDDADLLAASSDDTDASTTSTTVLDTSGGGGKTGTGGIAAPVSSSTPTKSAAAAADIIDRDMIREMSRILQTLERKATKLNRSWSLNYKSHKDCCCNGSNGYSNYRRSQQQQHQQQQHQYYAHSPAYQQPLQPHRPGTTTSTSSCSSTASSGGSLLVPSASANALTKDEKTNTNKKRQIQQDVVVGGQQATGKHQHHRRHGGSNRSIKRRHTVGGTHDYDARQRSCHRQQGDGAAAMDDHDDSTRAGEALADGQPTHGGDCKENVQPTDATTTVDASSAGEALLAKDAV